MKRLISGIVTAATGAAIRDIMTVSARRNPYVQLILYPALVQGDGAAESIVRGIRMLEQKDVDVIIIGRGGGSIEDLWAFNEEEVAEAIYESEIPVISAVGHETDFTIADFVSDMRAPTPSAAAEIVAPDYREILYAADKMLDTMTDSVDRLITRLTMDVMTNERIIAEFSPQKTIQFYSQWVEACESKFGSIISSKLNYYDNALAQYSARLEGTSPLKVLARGYAFIKDENGFTVNSAEKVNKDDKITVVMCDGKAECTVDEIVLNQ